MTHRGRDEESQSLDSHRGRLPRSRPRFFSCPWMHPVPGDPQSETPIVDTASGIGFRFPAASTQAIVVVAVARIESSDPSNS